MSPIDYLVVIGYLGIMAVIGLWFSRKNTSTEEYFVGGRSFPGWVIGLSMVGTSISSVTFVSFPADSFKTGWLRFIPNLALPLVVIVAALVFLPYFRRAKLTTAYEYLEARFGASVRVYVACVFMISQLFRVSLILYLISLVVHEMTGLDPVACVIVGGVFVALYTIVGGIDAVIWTDVIQTLTLLVGGVLCLAIVAMRVPDGVAGIFRIANEFDKFSLSEFAGGVAQRPVYGLSLSEKTVSMMFIVGFLTFLKEYCGGQNTVQRYVAARSEREARKAMFICAGMSVPIWAFFMFLGTSLFAFYQVHPDPVASEILSGGGKAEQILPHFVTSQLPVGLTGLIIAATIAAAMSSLDSSINSLSTVFIVDVYRRFLVKDRSDRHYLRVDYVAAAIAGVLMIGGATLLHSLETKTLQDTFHMIAALLGGGLLGVYCVGFFTRRGGARSIWCGVAFTLMFTAWSLIAKHYPEILPSFLRVPFELYYTDIIGNTIMFVLGYSLDLICGSRSARNLTGLTVWDAPVAVDEPLSQRI